MSRRPVTFGVTQLSEAVRAGADLFERDPSYTYTDQAIKLIVSPLRGRIDPASVLAKVAAINSLYATTIFAVQKLATHVSSLDSLRGQLKAGDLEAVKRIRHGHGIQRKGKELDFLSFAAKYCAWHNQRRYRIWDNLVSYLLRRLFREWGATLDATDLLAPPDERDYPGFMTAMNNLQRLLEPVRRLSYKRFDQGMWLVAKVLYEPEKVSDTIRSRIRDALDTGEWQRRVGFIRRT